MNPSSSNFLYSSVSLKVSVNTGSKLASNAFSSSSFNLGFPA